MSRPARPVVAHLAVTAVVAVAGWLALAPLFPPAPAGSDAPAEQFSATRSLERLPAIASGPRPAGSPANAAAAAYLRGELEALGLTVETMTTQGHIVDPSDVGVSATVTSLAAEIEGTSPTGTVLLVAHYDSAPSGPGASDNGVNAVGVIEIARALLAGPRPSSTVRILLTNDEEGFGLGGREYALAVPPEEVPHTVVVNLDARGVTGPTVMFQVVGDQGALIDAVGRSGLFASSLTADVYRWLPNDTDLTPFARAGFRGLDAAFIGGTTYHHSAQDDLAHVDPAVAQQIGQAALEITRALADSDLRETGSPAVTYFRLPGVLVQYPMPLAVPLAGLAVLALALVLGVHRRDLPLRQVAAATSTAALPLLVAAAAGFAGWAVVCAVRPDLGSVWPGDLPGFTWFAWGEAWWDPTRPEADGSTWFAWGEGLIVLAALVAWYGRARDRWSPTVAVAAGLVWAALLTVVLAVALPGGAYLFTWPTLLGAAGLTIAVRSGSRSVAVPGLALGGVAAVLLVLPWGVVLIPGLGLAMAAVSLVLIAAVGLLLGPLLEPLGPTASRVVVPVVLLVAAVGVFGTGLAVAG